MSLVGSLLLSHQERTARLLIRWDDTRVTVKAAALLTVVSDVNAVRVLHAPDVRHSGCGRVRAVVLPERPLSTSFLNTVAVTCGDLVDQLLARGTAATHPCAL